MTISMSQVQTIRQLKKEGESIAGISRKVGVSRDISSFLDISAIE